MFTEKNAINKKKHANDFFRKYFLFFAVTFVKGRIPLANSN